MVTDVSDLRAVRYEVADRIATVTLDRPRPPQRVDRPDAHRVPAGASPQAEADPEVRVVVVTGAGRGFCAGADAGALERQRGRPAATTTACASPLAEPGYGVRPEFDHAFAFHFGLAKPVIAAVNGPAAGVGLVLACYCDLRFAAAGAKLTTSAPRLGLPAEYGLSWVLPRLVGLGHAADLLLSSRVVLAEEAAAMGLVNKVLPPDELLPHTYDYARALATEVSPASLRETKRQIYADQHDDVGTAVERSVAPDRRDDGRPRLRRGRAGLDRQAPARIPRSRVTGPGYGPKRADPPDLRRDRRRRPVRPRPLLVDGHGVARDARRARRGRRRAARGRRRPTDRARPAARVRPGAGREGGEEPRPRRPQQHLGRAPGRAGRAGAAGGGDAPRPRPGGGSLGGAGRS